MIYQNNIKNQDNQQKIIHSRRMALFLIAKGFTPIGIRKNKKDETGLLKVFVFRDSENLRQTMNDKKGFDEFLKLIESYRRE